MSSYKSVSNSKKFSRQSLAKLDSEVLKNILLEILAIPSPSFGEKKLLDFLQKKFSKLKKFQVRRATGGLIVTSHGFKTNSVKNGDVDSTKTFTRKNSKHNHHLGFFGHLDVVPIHCTPRVVGDKIYGAGASDMKAGVAAMMYLIAVLEQSANSLQGDTHTFVFYCCEEVSSIQDNGMHSLLKSEGELLKSIDFCIVGEPTDKTLQLGAVGSAHALVRFVGKSSHSARPWDGVNAIYEATNFVQALEKIRPKEQKMYGVSFYDVINVTEVRAEEGRTTIPGWWEANVNYRFSPCYSSKIAKQNFMQQLIEAGAKKKNIDINSFVYAGKVVETAFFNHALKTLAGVGKLPVKAKQAWTDVAQLTQAGIPAINYGPGLTAQCHTDNEYTRFSHLKMYVKNVCEWMATLQNV